MRLSPNETNRNESVSRGKRPSVELLIAEMRYTAETMEAAIREELDRSLTRDPSDPKYSMLARSLGTRLNNLRATIESLEAVQPHSASVAA